MKVYGSIASPFVQRVLMAGRIKGRELPIEAPPGGDMRSLEFRAISPLGRIPVLAEGDWTLAESAAIVAYLDEVLEGPSLLPGGPRERAQVRLIETLASHELAGVRPIMVGKVFGRRDEPLLVEEARAHVSAGLAAIEKVRDPAHEWAGGPAPSVADCILLPLLTLMEIIDPIAGTGALIAEHPGISAYRERAASAPLGARTVDGMRQGFAAILERRRQGA